ncbi:lytic transglycosylase domain-containing protein [Bacteroidia bacterium]|jgi:membrane-bound lytic murein transglycosylase D|nr:lytic transglycosylase domain-containing protein [Bacteroidia bacterium]|tara:strand:+ start:1088 stop:1987 length:900 start_codon:yes stop_codon:yes gene_type:complete
MKRNYLIAIASFLILTLIFSSAKKDENAEQEDVISKGSKVVAVPIPSQINFAGEQVALDKFEVKERLDRELLVNSYWQSNSLLMIKRSKRAFEIIEPILAEYDVPEDFKYLAVAESGLLNVTSSAGAKGVWQFMQSTAKSYNLEVNGEVDERLHLKKSTIAACQYLKEAHTRFGSWTLAAAAYNRGPAGVERDLKKQQVGDYFDLHLNTETSRYVLRILALKTIFENQTSYGIHLKNEDYYGSISTINVVVDSSINNIAEYALQLGTNYHVLKSLNPWLKSNELTVVNKTYTIKAPLVN